MWYAEMLERSAAEREAPDERTATAVDEREVKLEAPPAFAMPDLATAAEGLGVAPAPPERTTTTYHDATDLRLARAGASLRFRTGQGWTVKLPGGEHGG